MPTYFMPAKDPAEAVTFFTPLVDNGTLRVIDATLRPDAYDRVQPTDDVFLIVDSADAQPPESVEFTAKLPEFRPTGTPEEQMATWGVEDVVGQPSSEDPSPDTSDVVQEAVESPVSAGGPAEVTIGQPDDGASFLDKRWTPYTSRGFKG